MIKGIKIVQIVILSFVMNSILFNSINAQVNLDSLRNVAINNYASVDSEIDYFGVIYTKYYDNLGDLMFLIYTKDGVVVDGDSGHNYALCYNEYDKNSRIIHSKTYGADGNYKMGETPPITNYYYDERGNEIRIDWFDETYKPMNGSARLDFEYDKDNNLILKESYNENYELSGKLAVLKNEYSKRGKVVKSSKYNYKNEISVLGGYAYRVIKYRTKSRNLVEELMFLDEFNRLSEGYHEGTILHRVKYEYDENDKLVRAVKFSKNGDLIITQK